MSSIFRKSNHSLRGFTIVELLIVIVVIAIIAVMSVMAFNGIQQRAAASVIANKEAQAKKKLETYKIDNGSYPPDQSAFDGITGQQSTGKFYTEYSTVPPYSSYTLATVGGSSNTVVISNGSAMQNISSANCPTTRTRTVDARDNRTYWVQKLSDGKCWMLTDLVYSGGGVNTYSDVKSIVHSTGGWSYTEARYFMPSNANPTTEPSSPVVSTSGSGQQGYFYNWCAAMGVQANTNACTAAGTPLADATVSICPAGWRLPTGNGGEFAALNTAVNNGLLNTDTGLRTAWLAQRNGFWFGGFNEYGNKGLYWSSTQNSHGGRAFKMEMYGSHVNYTNYSNKDHGHAVRCVAT